MHTDPWRRELLIAALLFGFGFLVLPFAIYWVGLRVVGEYAKDAGAFTLAEQVWLDFLRLEPTAWILVLSPYVVFQLARLVRRVWCARSTVKRVTNPSAEP
jgi:hypothetical protein